MSDVIALHLVNRGYHFTCSTLLPNRFKFYPLFALVITIPTYPEADCIRISKMYGILALQNMSCYSLTNEMVGLG